MRTGPPNSLYLWKGTSWVVIIAAIKLLWTCYWHFFPNIKVYRGSDSYFTKYNSPNCRTTDKFYEYAPIPFFGGSVVLDGYFQNEIYFPADCRAKFKVPYPGPGPVLDELIQTNNFEKLTSSTSVWGTMLILCMISIWRTITGRAFLHYRQLVNF